MYQTVFVQSIISEDLAFTGYSQKTLLPFSTNQCSFCGTPFNCYCPKSPHPNYYRTVLDTWISAPIPTLSSVVGFKNYMFPKKLPEWSLSIGCLKRKLSYFWMSGNVVVCGMFPINMTRSSMNPGYLDRIASVGSYLKYRGAATDTH